jgi:NADPH:quinone reductase-like Zn-dependent oxidoreductase
MDTMMALRAHARGGPEQLVYEQAPRPEPGAGEALVAVRATGITFAELSWDETWTTRDGADRTPVIPGHEVSGTVAAIGGNVTGVAAGDAVYGLIDFDRDGAAAEYVAVPATTLAGRPGSITDVEAATLPVAALTAWQALVDHARLLPGERALVQGGAGGVGVYAVQIASVLGGEVTATGRAASEDFVRQLGATEFVSVPSTSGHGQPDGFDVVIDTVGGEVLTASFDLLRPGGRLVTLAAPPDQAQAAEHKVRATFFVVAPDREDLSQIAELADQGRLRPIVSQTFALADGRRAYESGSQPHPPGKTVLVVA